MKAEFISPHASSLVMTRVGDYLQLTRPRLALLVLATVAAGWCLAAETDSQPADARSHVDCDHSVVCRRKRTQSIA